MSETRINSDGSATLTISGSSAPLEKALDAALKALSAFVSGASKKLGAFDGIASTTFDRVAEAANKALSAFGSFRQADFKFNVPKPASQASGSGGGGGGKKTSAPAPASPGGEGKRPTVDLSFPSFAFDMAGLEAVKSFGRRALDAFVGFGDEMDKMSQRTGFAVETLSAFSHAAGQCGTDLGTVEGAIRGFQSVLGDAANGSKDAAEKFERIGLNVAELVDLAPEEQFRRIMRAVASVENPTLRAAAAMEIFGDAGAQLGPMINGGADALDAYLKEAEEAGVVMSGEQAASAAALSDAFGRLKASFQAFRPSAASRTAWYPFNATTAVPIAATTAITGCAERNERAVAIPLHDATAATFNKPNVFPSAVKDEPTAAPTTFQVVAAVANAPNAPTTSAIPSLKTGHSRANVAILEITFDSPFAMLVNAGAKSSANASPAPRTAV